MFKKFILTLVFFSTTCFGQTLIIVPTAPGGAVDTLSRKFSQYAELKTNRSFIIENVSGAGGNIGITKFLKSSVNTLMITSGSWYISLNQDFTNIEDFKPIAILAEAPFFLLTNSTQNLTCKKLRTSNERYFLGTASMSHTELVGKVISKKYKNVENVPYKAIKPATMDLLGNHINLAIIGGAENATSPLTIIANSTDRKVNGIPSFLECLGIAGQSLTADFILLAHKNSDENFIKNIELLVTGFLNDKDTQEYYQQNIIHNPNIGLKRIDSKISERLLQWQKIGK